MSFAAEMDDFLNAFETGSRVRLNLTNRQKVYESYRQPTDAEKDKIAGEMGGWGGVPGPGVGETTAPSKRSAQGGDGITVPNAGGEGFLKQAYGYYRKKGLSHNHAAAIAGNLQMESAGDPMVLSGRHRGDGGKSAYAAQWKDNRLTNLMAFAKQRGSTNPTLQDQFDFVLEEGNPESPFMDAGAVRAHQLASQSKTVADATNAFMTNFERPNEDPGVNGIAKRIGWASSLGPDDGSGGTFAFERGADAAGIPEEDDGGYPEAAQAPATGEPLAPESPEITVVDAPAPDVEPLFVEDAPTEYEEGGAIPDDTQYFAEGGMPDPVTPDPYNPARGYTQPVAQTAPAAQARRISIPAPVSGSGGMPPGQDWRNWGSGGTPGGSPQQLQLRERLAGLDAQRAAAKAKAEADAKAAADKAAAEAAAKKAAEDAKLARMQQMMSMFGRQGQQRRGEGGGGSNRGGYTTSGPGHTGGMAGGFGSRSSSASRSSYGGGGLYEEGGPVDYKEGGPVKRNFEYENKAGTRMMVRGRGGDSVEYQMGPRRPKQASPPKAPARPRQAAPAKPKPKRPGPSKERIADVPPTPDQGGGMPQVDALGNPIGANYPVVESVSQAEIDRQNRNPKTGNPKLEKWKAERRRAAGDVPGPKLPPPHMRHRPVEGYNQDYVDGYDLGKGAKITVPGAHDLDDPTDMETSFGGAYAAGGAIPDDERAPPRNSRQNDAGYDYGGRRKKKKAAPAAPQTKSAKKQRPKSTAKPQNRNQKKRQASPRLPDQGPIPGNRPSRFPDEGPIPAPRSASGVSGPTPGRNRQEDEAGIMSRMYRDRLGPGQMDDRPAPPPAPSRFPGEMAPPGGRPTPGGYTPGANRQEGEARIMGQMQRDRLGPGQTDDPYRPAPPRGPLRQQPAPTPRFRQHPAEGYDVPPRGPPPGPPPDDPGYDGPEATPWLAFAKGGAIPDDEEGPYPNSRAEEAGYTTSSADPRVVAATAARPGVGDFPPAPPPPVAADRMAGGAPGITPTRQLAEAEAQPTQAEPPRPDFDPRQVMRAASDAVKVGSNGIKRIFGMGDAPGAVPTPEDDARKQDGMRRFASGEGAATRQEVQAADFAFGLDQVKADEGTKNLMRMEAAVHWHLQRGDKDKAEAVAASFLIYGAKQVSQAGMMAQVAFQKYQQTGNPQDLRNASLAVQRAHQMIPDGLNMKIDIDPKTRQIVATTIDSDGNEDKQIVDPTMIPQVLQSAMDGSAYWEAIEQVGQPEFAKAANTARINAENKRADRDYNEGWEQSRWERNQTAAQEKEERAAAQKLADRALDNAEGRTADERDERAMETFFVDWGDQMKAATTPEEKQQLLEEGLGYRYDNTRSRKEPLADEDIMGAVEGSQVLETEDQPFALEIARMLADRNPQLDEGGVAQAAEALITGPKISPQANGTLYANGIDLVFNPLLLPQLIETRQRYKQ